MLSASFLPRLVGEKTLQVSVEVCQRVCVVQVLARETVIRLGPVRFSSMNFRLDNIRKNRKITVILVIET